MNVLCQVLVVQMQPAPIQWEALDVVVNKDLGKVVTNVKVILLSHLTYIMHVPKLRHTVSAVTF